MGPTRARAAAATLTLLLVAPAFSGCLGLGTTSLIVAASAPKAASGMTLFVVSEEDILAAGSGGDPEYSIYYGSRLVYPLAGKGASFKLDGRTATLFVPYSNFVVGNGDYDVVIKQNGAETRVRVAVEKWANYVYLHPFDQGSTIRVEAALSSATGGSPQNRILAEGDLLVSLHYRGLQGNEDSTLGQYKVRTQNDATSTRIDVPRAALSAGPGCYSFEPVFHNAEAKNNLQVKADPTLANRNPPWNWICITR